MITKEMLDEWRQDAVEGCYEDNNGRNPVQLLIALVEELAQGTVDATDNGSCMPYTERAHAALDRARALLDEEE